MQILFISVLISLFGISLYLASWASSIICSVALLTLLWARLFAKWIIKSHFKSLTPMRKTEFHYLEEAISKSFLMEHEQSAPQIFIDLEAQNLQLYCFGNKQTPQIVASKTLLDTFSIEDLQEVSRFAGSLHTQNVFANRQTFVAVFVYIVNIGRYLDAALSFVLGIKTKNGEPKALIRRPIYFILSQIKLVGRRPKNHLSCKAIQSYSYLSFKHQQPILSPLSVVDKALQ